IEPRTSNSGTTLNSRTLEPWNLLRLSLDERQLTVALPIEDADRVAVEVSEDHEPVAGIQFSRRVGHRHRLDGLPRALQHARHADAAGRHGEQIDRRNLRRLLGGHYQGTPHAPLAALPLRLHFLRLLRDLAHRIANRALPV